MSLGFILACAAGFVAFLAIAERWSVLVAGAALLAVAALL